MDLFNSLHLESIVAILNVETDPFLNFMCYWLISISWISMIVSAHVRRASRESKEQAEKTKGRL